MADQRIIRIFGIPMDLGQRRRGVDMGPSALRYARLQRSLEKLGYDVWDMGNIAVAQVEELVVKRAQGQAVGFNVRPADVMPLDVRRLQPSGGEPDA